MKIKNLNELDIIDQNNINSNFVSVNLEKLDLNYKIFKGDFYLDSFNYFPITKDNFTFLDLFRWKVNAEYDHYFTKKFYSNFKKNKNTFKEFNNVVVLGSSPGDNYFRNLITFIPRLFFIPDRQVNLVIHRSTSNKLRKFIENILKNRGIELNRFIYLDDDFYSFRNSQMPQFISKITCIKILNKIFKKSHKNKKRIYLTRKNAYYRKIINESDLIEVLQSKNFTIIDYKLLSIDELINVFSSAEIIISPTSSALANIVFCHEGTKVFEITPKYQHKYENNLKSRYAFICNLLGFSHYSIEADPIPVENHSKNTEKFIDKNVISQSNYYKNLLVKKDNFKKFINQI